MTDSDPPPDHPRFCQRCGSGVELRFLEAEGRERHVCAACGFVHYLNPRLVANVLPERAGRVLLLRRAIEPGFGKWAFPGGYLELGESAEAGAERETWEEVGLRVTAGPLLGVYTRIDHGVVVLVFRGIKFSGRPVAGPEVLETAWFRPHEIPWPDLAFETTVAALRDWVRLATLRSRRGKPAR
jgi:ADP-ribose pyrophosphatase YjhB (NUDIX family)